MIQDLNIIRKAEEERQDENEDFLFWLRKHDGAKVDAVVHSLNNVISDAIDCTSCGNCCRSLMINVEPGETERLAAVLNLPTAIVKEKYIEESLQGKMIVNTIPCHFLSNNMCSIYEDRFAECREFPHLHKPGFIRRLPGTLMHYGRCPIIFNLIESVKTELKYEYIDDTV